MSGGFITEVDVNGASARIFVPGRPPLLNAERSAHWRKHRDTTRQLRKVGYFAGCNLTNVKGYRFPDQVIISSYPVYATKRSWPDVGNWFPTTKALVDGLVDADAWPDDNAEHVVGLLFEQPRLAANDGLYLIVTPFEE